MVVRDEQGNILNPEITSVVELFRQHKLATQRIQASSVSARSRTANVLVNFSNEEEKTTSISSQIPVGVRKT